MLIDPDELSREHIAETVANICAYRPDFVFAGGSLITTNEFDEKLRHIRAHCSLPLVLFPGSPTQLTEHVDAVLFLSLLSGRNAELLIGHHVTAAPRIRELGIEAVATAYLLVDGGRPTTASYISGTQPIPRNKPAIAAATALAGELLGMHVIYLDAGSGADQPVPAATIRAVRENTHLPIIVGGGIQTAAQRDEAHAAGADLVVIGTAIERSPERLFELLAAPITKGR